MRLSIIWVSVLSGCLQSGVPQKFDSEVFLPPGRTQEAKEILISTENRFHLQRSDCFSVMQSTCKAFYSYSPDLES